MSTTVTPEWKESALSAGLPKNARPGFYLLGRYYNNKKPGCFNKCDAHYSEPQARQRLESLSKLRAMSNRGTIDEGPLFAELEIVEVKAHITPPEVQP